jgi:2-polyprenyl-3-methyl-5-hydroxy-6-metoxy-1,4-benzoquinol methylase
MTEAVMKRYTENRHWRLYEKEWIYRNFPPAGKTWLDFGCGTGEITSQLALLGAARVIAIDLTPGLLEMTQKQAELDGVAERVLTICGDVTTVPPYPVDFVLAFAVLHHIPGGGLSRREFLFSANPSVIFRRLSGRETTLVLHGIPRTMVRENLRARI